MTTIIPATFDGSVFRPKEPVTLAPNTEVRLIVETEPDSTGTKRSFIETALAQNLEGPPDWSANLDRYLYGDLHREEDGGET